MAPLLPYAFQGLAVWLFRLTVSQNHQKLSPTCTTGWPSPQQLFVLLFLINLSLCRTWQLERISLLVTSLGMWDRFHPSLLSSCPSLLDGNFNPPMKVCHLPSPPHSWQVLIPPEPLASTLSWLVPISPCLLNTFTLVSHRCLWPLWAKDELIFSLNRFSLLMTSLFSWV